MEAGELMNPQRIRQRAGRRHAVAEASAGGLVGQETADRGARGRFAKGNLGGPGRPRRAVEREYLAALSAAVSLDDWREIVQRAVTDAKGGDATARVWLARYLVGDKLTLAGVAAREAAQVTVEQELEVEGREVSSSLLLRNVGSILDEGRASRPLPDEPLSSVQRRARR